MSTHSHEIAGHVSLLNPNLLHWQKITGIRNSISKEHKDSTFGFQRVPMQYSNKTKHKTWVKTGRKIAMKYNMSVS